MADELRSRVENIGSIANVTGDCVKESKSRYLRDVTVSGISAGNPSLSDGVSSPKSSKEPQTDIVYDRDLSFMRFFYAEVTKGYNLDQDETKLTDKRKRVYTFMKIPKELEKFMFFGFLQCLDVFLHQLTLMPLRFIISAIYISKIPFSSCWRTPSLESAQICDFLKGIIFITALLLMNYVDVSMMYHIIRGQAIIKLYIFFNMLEVADRLFSSFGQDIMDSLFWTATEPRGRRREHVGVLPHLALAVLYVFLHTLLTLFQATTLNVAFNSHNKALLTIMMSNNFVELKGSVFKKFEKNNLFQMSCADVRERFHFVVLLGVVCIRNMAEFSWNVEHLWVLIPDVVMVMACEAMVDWVKHAFITKFNDISSEVYNEYTRSLAHDLVNSRRKQAVRDHLDVVSRRMGFAAPPVAVLLVRVLWQSVSLPGGLAGTALCLSLFISLLVLRMVVSIIVLRSAFAVVDAAESRSRRTTETSAEPPSAGGDVDLASSGDLEMTSVPTAADRGEQSDSDLPDVSELRSPLPLSSSSVSLQSMGLLESGPTSPVTSQPGSEGTVLSHRNTDKQRDKPSLDEIDRYTMCSNRII